MGHQHGGRDPGHRRPGHFTTVNDPHAPPVSTFVGAINNSGLITGDTSTPTACFSGSSTGVGCSPRSMTGRAQGTAAEALSNTGVIVGFYTDTHGSHGYTFTPAR